MFPYLGLFHICLGQNIPGSPDFRLIISSAREGAGANDLSPLGFLNVHEPACVHPKLLWDYPDRNWHKIAHKLNIQSYMYK